MQEYNGKTIFVGIDVHKKTYAVTCMCEGIVVKKAIIKAMQAVLYKFLTTYFSGATINTGYEAGFSGFALHRHLVSQGINNYVVHAASIEISAHDRVKTDKRDSLKIAQQLSAGRLRGIHVLSEEREAYREVTRLREKIGHITRQGRQSGITQNFVTGSVGGDKKNDALLTIFERIAKTAGKSARLLGLRSNSLGTYAAAL